MNPEPINPTLAKMETQYDNIVSQWNDGKITPEQGQAALLDLVATDAVGVAWRIDIASGEWQACPHGAAAFQMADPAQYTEETPQQVDDWSAPSASTGAQNWQHDDSPELPQDWSENREASWVPPGAPAAGQPGFPGGNPQPPPPPPPGQPAQNDHTALAAAGGVAAGAAIGATVGGNPPPYSPPPGQGSAQEFPDQDLEFVDGYDNNQYDPYATQQQQQMLDMMDDDENKFSKVWNNLPGGIFGKIAVVAVIVIVLFGVFMLFSSGGRSCGDTGFTLGDVSEQDQPDVQCVLSAPPMMTAVEINEELNVITFTPNSVVVRRDMSRSLGLSYVAIGGIPQISPVPPDIDNIDPGATATREAVINAYAAGIVSGNVASNDPVSVQSAMDGVASLVRLTGSYDPSASSYDVLLQAGVIDAEVLGDPGAAITRVELARWLAALWRSGLTIDETSSAAPSNDQTTIPGTQTTVPSDDTPDAALPTTAAVQALVDAVTSGDRAIASEVVVEAGSVNNIALQSAQLNGLRVGSLLVTVPGVPALGDADVVYAELVATDSSTSSIVARARVAVVRPQDSWMFQTWPVFIVEGEQ